MKKVVSFIICLVLAVGLYLPCRDLAVLERGMRQRVIAGTEYREAQSAGAIGGEVLVPVLVMLGWLLVSEWESEKEGMMKSDKD